MFSLVGTYRGNDFSTKVSEVSECPECFSPESSLPKRSHHYDFFTEASEHRTTISVMEEEEVEELEECETEVLEDLEESQGKQSAGGLGRFMFGRVLLKGNQPIKNQKQHWNMCCWSLNKTYF